MSPRMITAAAVLLLVLASMPVLGKGRRWRAARAAGTDRLAFVSLRAGEIQIYGIDADGQGERRLTGPPGQNVIPVWSPDGRRLVLISSRAGDFSVLPIFAWKPR